MANLRVAFVGNSLTYFNDLPSMFANVSAALPSPVAINHSQSTPGGSSLFQHANASLPMGRDTRALLGSGPWDVVVLQDQSQTPGGGRNGENTREPRRQPAPLPRPGSRVEAIRAGMISAVLESGLAIRSGILNLGGSGEPICLTRAATIGVATATQKT